MLQKIISVGCLIFLYSFASNAAIELNDEITLSGFGSTSIAQATSESPLFVNREITDELCFDCDTTLGLQLDYEWNDEIEASMQVVKRPQDDWSDPELEWLYVSYSSSDLEVKLGRLRLPLFLISEYYYVSQAYVWARPPQEVYGSILGITSFNGVSLSWDHYLSEEIVLTVGPYYGGHNKMNVYMGDREFEFTTNNIKGLYIDITGFNYRIHSNVMQSNYDQELRVSGVSMPRLENQELLLYSLGGEYLFDKFQLMAEVQNSEMQTSWYTSVAYNINVLTPYIIYSESYGWKENYSVTSGVRYDLTTKVSINAEWQMMTLIGSDESNSGQFTINEGDKQSNVATFIVNFIF